MKTRLLTRYAITALTIAAAAHAQEHRKNPTSKIYVADTQGDTDIDTGNEIDDLTKKSVYKAGGTVIESKSNSNASVVLSNGTGLYFDVGTRVVIKGFEQEPFRPNRTDIDDEPSVSHSKLYIDHGVVGISTSKMVAGSSMEYDTSLATALIHGRQAVVLAKDNLTVVSMIQGDATVQAGPLDHPRQIHGGQQIVVQPGKPGEQNIVEVQDIPDGQSEDSRQWLYERVLTADSARHLVYFDVAASKGSGGLTLFDGDSSGGPAGTGAAGSAGSRGQGAGGSSGTGSGTGGTTSGDDGGQDLEPVPIQPNNNLPLQPTVSPANLFGH